MDMNPPDLTKYPPRSPRVRLGGYVMLPRMLDKGRATVSGLQGEYKYNCPMDQHFLKFTGVDPELLKQQLATGQSDAEMLAWITAHSTTQPTPCAIAAWSAYMEHRGPADVEGRGFFQAAHQKLAPHREDVATWFDLLDLDDFVTFGGRP